MNLKLVAAYIIICVLLLGSTSCSLKTQPLSSPAEFYRGKSVDLISTGSPGVFDDLLSHIVAAHMEKDMGCIVKVTSKQGAGGMEGLNSLYKDEPDGLSLGNTPAAKYIGNKIMADPAAEYDIDKFSYLLNVGHEQMYFFVSPQGPYQSVQSLQSAENLKLGAGSASGNLTLAGLTVIKLLKLEARVIPGFKGESERALAVKRGEIGGYCITISDVKEEMASGLIKPLFVLSSQRDPLMPEVPAISELVSVTGDDMELLKFWEVSFVSSSIFIAPPGIPEDRLSYLCSQADHWIKDEGFRREVDRAAGHRIEVYDTGDRVTQNMLILSRNLTKFQSTFIDLMKKYRG
jgi:tripartite-type tricarboxylate transporter receptor subunit TctC